MAKTITVRIDDNTYDLLKKAADGQKRTISNFMEFAALNYIVSDSTVDEHEMAEILEHAEDLRVGLADVQNGRYEILG